MSIEARLASFLASKEGGSIVLQGKWGTGKTYFWRHKVMASILAKPWKKKYSYVSLFGVETLTELKLALAVASVEFDRDAKQEWWKSASVLRLWWRFRGWLGDVLEFIPTVGDKLGAAYRKVSFYRVRDRIICFDDIERRGGGLPLKDFLGMVSYLVDIRGCRVAVILNTGALGDDQAIWDANREKVFDGEFTYAPKLEDTVGIGLEDDADAPWHGIAHQSLIELGVSNIRLVKRTSRALRQVMETAGKQTLEPDTIAHIGRVVPLLVYSAHGSGEGAPPLDMITRDGAYALDNPLIWREEDMSSTERAQRAALRSYGVTYYQALDHALLDMVRTGYADREQLLAGVSAFESNRTERRLMDEYHAAWRTFHDTVAENGDEIADAFERTWPPVSATQHAHSVQSVARVLRLVGRPDRGTAFIQNWVQQRLGIEHSFDPRMIHSYSPIDDAELLEAIAQGRSRQARTLPLREAFNLWMEEGSGFNEGSIAAFAAATPAEIVELLDGTRDERLTEALRKVMSLDGNPGNQLWSSAVANVKDACAVIAARSSLNAYRMRTWLRIEPPAPAGEPADA